MYFRTLGNLVEYHQAAKRLEQIADAKPNTLEAEEYKSLLKAFLHYERDLNAIKKSSNFIDK